METTTKAIYSGLILLLLVVTNGFSMPAAGEDTTYAQVRHQVPEKKLEPVVGMAVEDIMQSEKTEGRSAITRDLDTLDTIIEWINSASLWSEENVANNVIP